MSIVTYSSIALGLVLVGCIARVDDAQRETSPLNESGFHYRVREVPSPKPAYSSWSQTGLSADGAVFGFGFGSPCPDGICPRDTLKLDADGAFSVLARQFFPRSVNSAGVVAGCVEVPSPATSQAALIDDDGSVELFPHAAGEVSSCAERISEGGTVLVHGYSAGKESYYVVTPEATLPIVLDSPELPAAITSTEFTGLNDRGELSGTFHTYCALADRAFRYDPHTGTTSLLEPASGDQLSFGAGIDQTGSVLGYSYANTGRQRIGTWNSAGEFSVLFTQGTPEFPTFAPALVGNDAGLVVLSRTSDNHTYLVPEAGVRLDLATLVESGSAPLALNVFALTPAGDFLGNSFRDGKSYVLVRTDESAVAAP